MWLPSLIYFLFFILYNVTNLCHLFELTTTSLLLNKFEHLEQFVSGLSTTGVTRSILFFLCFFFVVKNMLYLRLCNNDMQARCFLKQNHVSGKRQIVVSLYIATQRQGQTEGTEKKCKIVQISHHVPLF